MTGKEVDENGKTLWSKKGPGKEDDNDPKAPAGGKDIFTTFKHFIDDRLFSFTTRLAEHRKKMRDEQERLRRERQEIETRWTGSLISPDHTAMEKERSTHEEREEAFQAAIKLVSESCERNANVSVDKIKALYRDPEGYLKFRDWQAQTWLSTSWFKKDPYSPITLEARPELVHYGSHWRAAFEDLMSASLDKPMVSEERFGTREPYGKPNSTYFGPGLEWMLSLHCRGLLPPFLAPRAKKDGDSSNGNLHQTTIMQDLLLMAREGHVSRPRAGFGPHSDTIDLANVSQLAWEITTKPTIDVRCDLRTPRTEQELYDALKLPSEEINHTLNDIQMRQMLHAQQMRKEQVEAEADKARLREAESKGYSEEEKLWFAEQQIWDALDDRNIDAATQVINEWYRRAGDIEQLFEHHLRSAYDIGQSEPSADWLRIWNAAVRRSDLPEDDPDKVQAWSDKAEAMAAFHEQGKLDRPSAIRNSLELRFDNLVGKPADESLSNAELRHMVERLEEEYANLTTMTGRKPSNENADIPLKKVDVLSALTTTHTTRLADGTVTTRVTLKQRFADGREETTESIHTSNEKEAQSRANDQETSEKKSGWFWS